MDVETQEFSLLSTSSTSLAPRYRGVGDALAVLSDETMAVEGAQGCNNPPSLYTNHFCLPPASSLLNNSEPVINGGAPPLPIHTRSQAAFFQQLVFCNDLLSNVCATPQAAIPSGLWGAIPAPCPGTTACPGLAGQAPVPSSAAVNETCLKWEILVKWAMS